MLEWLLRLLGMKREAMRDVNPILRTLIHSQALTDAVGRTPSSIDDLILRLLRAIVPPPDEVNNKQ